MVKRESHSSDHLTGGSHRRIMTTKLATAIAAFFLLASIAVIIAIATVQVKRRTYLSPGLKYGIVLDAGSSRTTVYLYQWPAEKENNTGVVTQTSKCQVKGPGISEMNPGAWNSLKKCMEDIANAIPTNQHESTPIFLGATAGMRLLQSGRGLYGWITVNYLKGNFLEKNIWNAWIHPLGAQTVGSLDLGGASTQIAFTAPPDTRGADLIKVSLYGYEYNVYTHSFLCYGKNEAEKKVLAELVKMSSNSSRINHPCYPLGYNITIPGDNIYDSECTKNSIPPSYTRENQFTFFGHSDPAKCKTLVKRIFDLNSCQGNEHCSFSGVYQPPVTGDFMAYAGFYYTAEALDIKGSNSLEKFNSTVWSFCTMDWKTVNKTSIAWSLGYMLAQSNMIPAEAKLLKLPISKSVFATLLFLFSALTIITLMFLIIKLVQMFY